MNKLKAIETEYDGCRFRSRLEARWAVFFNELGISWEYEKQGYDLGEAGRYLPDFWLPGMDCFFEVKGDEPNEDEINKAVELSEASQKLVAISSGTMQVEKAREGLCMRKHPGKIELFRGYSWRTWGERPCPYLEYQFLTALLPFLQDQFPNVSFDCENEEQKRALLVEYDKLYYSNKYRKDHPCYKYGYHQNLAEFFIDHDNNDSFTLGGNPEILDDIVYNAYKKATSARFEHGERG